MVSPHITAATPEKLQAQVKGRVFSPQTDGYETARRPWSLTMDQHPALILAAENTDDVVAGVRFARENNLGVAVQTTGHGLKAPADGGLLILMSNLSSVEVDPAARTAKVGGGAVWKQVVEKTVPHGLAPLLGSSPGVGVVGYTLGGGMGWLTREFGLAVDKVTALDIVTADGELRHVSRDEHSDLFWALRGAGSGFGVVTNIEFALVPVTKLYGGDLIYPGDKIPDALRFYREWVKSVPNTLTSSISVIKLPNAPFLPEPMRGKSMVNVKAAFNGSATDGAALMQPWLDWSAPETNTLREVPFGDVGTISNDPVQPAPGYGTNMLLDDLSDAVIDVILKDLTAPIMSTEIRHGGGAISRADGDQGAHSNRDAGFYLQMGGLAPTPEVYAAMKSAVKRYGDDLRRLAHRGAYLNFVIGGEVPGRLREAFPPAVYDRLAKIKAKYDPDNLFRFGYDFTAQG